VHLKVPKAASTTLFDLVYALSGANAFSVESRPMYLDGARVNASAGEYAAFFAGLPADPPTLRTAHGPYLDYRWWGLQREPAYFGLARDPLARLASHYEYVSVSLPLPLLLPLLLLLLLLLLVHPHTTAPAAPAPDGTTTRRPLLLLLLLLSLPLLHTN